MDRQRVSASWVFKDTEYVLSCCATDVMLEVTVEETISTNRWKGVFESKHIEEITRKTGNFKQFLVFVTMLESAISKSSGCLTLDLLTYADLETLRERRNTAAQGVTKPTSPQSQHQQQQQQPHHSNRYLILTYSVEFDRIHYPLALPYAGQADAAQLRETVRRMATELDKYKKQGERNAALARLQKDYDALQREKESLEEAIETLRAQLMAREGGGEGGGNGEGKGSKQLKMLQKIIRNLEEEMLQERSKHQRYTNKKTEEMRALTQELGELRSSERTLRSRVKNLTNELSMLKRGLRFSPSVGYLCSRRSPSYYNKTPPTSSSGGVVGRMGGLRRRSHSGSLERRGLSAGSRERRGLSGGGRSKTPSPRGGRLLRFDPSAYVENKRRQQKEIRGRFQRLHSPSYHGSGTHSRSSSVEKPILGSSGGGGGGVGRRPPVHQQRSRRLWGPTPESLKGTRTRSSSLGSLSGRSSGRGSSASSSRASSRRPSLSHLSDIEPSPPTSLRGSRTASNKNKSRGLSGKSSHKQHSSTPNSTKGSNKNNGSLLDHSAEMSEIDARLNALQQFMKRSLEASSKSHYKMS